jgi:4-hydroxy-tetrahydrodipicolinate synthase
MDYARSEAKAWSQKNLKGFYDAPLTPFTENGQLDEAGIRENVEAFIDMGMDGLSVGGFIAEAWNLKLFDWLRYHEIYADAVRGRIDLSTIILDASVHQALEKLGFNSDEIMNPSVQLKTDDEIFSFYKYISDHSDMAVVLYRTPVSGTLLSMELMPRLADLEII